MKYLLCVIIILLVFASCTRYTCYPTKGSRDYASVKPIKNGKFDVTIYGKFNAVNRIITDCNPCENGTTK